jgi:ubiquinone/menaquinone biosynthesis C-methylase UbiE
MVAPTDDQLVPDTISADELRRASESTIEERGQVEALLRTIQTRALPMLGRRTAGGQAEHAFIASMDEDHIVLRTEHIALNSGRPLLLNVEVDRRRYFLGISSLVTIGNDLLRAPIPRMIFQIDRRDRARQVPSGEGAPRRVLFRAEAEEWNEATVEDHSPVGLRLRCGDSLGPRDAEHLWVRFIDGSFAGQMRAARLRHRHKDEAVGRVTLGLSLSEVVSQEPIKVRHLQRLTEPRTAVGLRLAASQARAGAALLSERWLKRVGWERAPGRTVRVLDYDNARGEPMRAIVDVNGQARGAVAVVIPPAWGRTKETLLPLAATVVATFRAAGESVVVVRFDGTRRRGESYTDPECRSPGRESEKFTVSGAVSDILGTMDFLEQSSDLETRRVVLVTFSAASIEGRRAVLEDKGRRIRGWISVVGAPDLQSGMRTVSGGVDYFGGAERGARFGFQEIMGVRVNIDAVAEDALRHRLAFLEDARRDMSQIVVPVVWIHGREDAWLDLERVREVMSCGSSSIRRLLSVPAGHQLRDSRQALEVFQLVARETFEVGIGRRCRAAFPRLIALERQRRAERARRPRVAVDLGQFWHQYLLGRAGHIGIELMTATSAYRALMEVQVKLLDLVAGARVADLGAGTGPFAMHLRQQVDSNPGVRIDMVDLVAPALARAQSLLARAESKGSVVVSAIAADLGGIRAIPFANARYDRLVASLLLSYVRDPQGLLREMYRILRPGGVLVASTLRLDADVSGLFMAGLDELRSGVASIEGADTREVSVVDGARHFLNDAARILTLEEEGQFRFWEPAAFERLVQDAGFVLTGTEFSFGDPPQALVVAARRPD